MPEFVPAISSGLLQDASAMGADAWGLAVRQDYGGVRQDILALFSGPMRAPSLPDLQYGFWDRITTVPSPYSLRGVPVRGWIFPSARWLDGRLRGPNNMADGSIDRAYLELRRNEK